MIIELKRPTKRKEDKDAVQLEDYMVKEECRFGLLVGEALELYFIDFSKPKHRAELISSITFGKDNDDAKNLISLLLAQNYDTDNMCEYCSQQQKLNNAVRYWNSQDGKDNLITYILKSSSLPESLKNRLQPMIKIEVKIHQPIQLNEETGETPQSVLPTTSNDFHLFKVKMKGTDASIRYYPSEHRYVVMSHSLIRKGGTNSFKNQAAIAKRNEVISDKTWSRDLGESIELLRDVEFFTVAPNTPTHFCTARSTNATEALIDEDGKRFADVFPKDKESKLVTSDTKPLPSSSRENDFKESCINRIIKASGKELVRVSDSTYLSSDGKSGYVFRASQTYKQGNRKKYWYSYRRKKDISKCKSQYYVFGFQDDNTIIILPVSEIESQIEGLNYSQDSNGNPSYWHIVFFKDEKGKVTWLISKPKVFEIDITHKILL